MGQAWHPSVFWPNDAKGCFDTSLQRLQIGAQAPEFGKQHDIEHFTEI